ncbi:hypothetical protein BaRGS_00038725 [Batillaria attramentaria]|uniref:Uncharacterized protein n=1 Tax=Batillaria attramentaria TaxID=370345 RepID=A0ABD0J523_9CAEN
MDSTSLSNCLFVPRTLVVQSDGGYDVQVVGHSSSRLNCIVYLSAVVDPSSSVVVSRHTVLMRCRSTRIVTDSKESCIRFTPSSCSVQKWFPRAACRLTETKRIEVAGEFGGGGGSVGYKKPLMFYSLSGAICTPSVAMKMQHVSFLSPKSAYITTRGMEGCLSVHRAAPTIDKSRHPSPASQGQHDIIMARGSARN